MIASLGMYDVPPLAAAHDALWAGLRDRLQAAGIAAPAALTRGPGAYWPAWEAADLVLSQTCGLPFRARLHGRVTLVAAPDHGLPGCPPGHYRSLYLVREGDPRHDVAAFDGARLAYNEALSQSGWAAPQADAAARGIAFAAGPRTGSHVASAAAVAASEAEIAAVDAVTWAIVTEQGLAPAGLRVAGETTPTPALPYIAGPGADAEAVAKALEEAIAALPATLRDALHLRGIVRLPAEAWLALPLPRPPGTAG
jgi:ABC-type phosphate/phosphonate transport system substrate-binding protein